MDGPTLSMYLDGVSEPPDSWGQWQELIHSDQPDLLAILKLGAQFQAYFATVESEALQAARMAGLTWAQLGEALGTSRQAVWQRATTWDSSGRHGGTADRSRPDGGRLANLQKAQEDWARRRDQAAATMFDGPATKTPKSAPS